MDQWLNLLNDWLSANPGWLSAAIAGTALLESLAIAGLVVPGVAMLFVIAAAAGHHEFSLWVIMGWACLGAILGDGISFWIGRYFKSGITTLWPFSRYPNTLRQGEDFFRRHGGKSVVLGRFVGPVRPIVPMIAGALDMPARRFLLFNVLSALGWAPLYIIPGYLVGASMTVDPDLPRHFYPVLLISLFCLAAGLALFFRVHLGMLPQGELYDAARRLMLRYPSSRRIWTGFVRRRDPSRDTADGGEFPLASLALALASTAGLIAWTLTVLHTDWLAPFNNQTVDFFRTLRFELLDPLFLAVTLSGDAVLLGIGFALFSAVFFWSGHRAAAVHMLAGGVAVALLTAGLKEGFYLVRPENVALPPPTPAYPSGHTSGVTALYGLIAAFVAQEYPIEKRWRVYALAVIPVVLVALSRLYLGVHWFSDTVGGLLLGLAVCGVVRVSFSRHDWARLPLRGPFSLALVAWLALIMVYVALRWQEAVRSYAVVALG